MNRTLGSLLLLLLMPTLMASEINDMYSDAELRKDKVRYERRINELYRLGLQDYLTGSEKRLLDGTLIAFPLKGNGPLDVYADSGSGQLRVVLPVMSLKFIEDLSLAYAWRHLNRYSLKPIDEYLAMLKYREASDFPNSRIPDPISALGVPPRIWQQDKRVDDLSLRFRNTAWAFILAHELAHLRFQHPGNQKVSAKVSQTNEEEADRFAVVLLSRSDTIPMGMVLWFQATIAYFPNRADFNSEQAYRRWMQNKATHPVNAQRLQRLGIELNRAAAATLNPDHAQSMRLIATQIITMGDIMAEPDMHRLIARCAVRGDPKKLKRLHGSACDKNTH